MNTDGEVWIWAEQRNGKLMEVSLEVLGKGLELANKTGVGLAAILIGNNNIEAMAKELIAYGANKVYLISDPQLEFYQNNAYVRLISELIEQYKPEIMLLGATVIGTDLAPTIAARVKTGLTAHCSDLCIENIDNKPQLITTVPGFGGGIMVRIACLEKRPQMATVGPGVMKKADKDETRQGEIVRVEAQVGEEDLKARTVEMVERQPAGMPVESASIVVAGGRGLKAAGGFKPLQELAEMLGAAIGGTRPARDAGWISEENLIGSSGKTVRPKLFVSIGASGAMHFSSGFSRAKSVLAINNDSQAPIFEVCDLGIVADLNEIVPCLIKELKKTKQGV